MAGRYFTKSGFARYCKVSPPSISFALNSGTVVEIEEGDYAGRIDIADPINVAYYERSKLMEKKKGKPGRPVIGASAELKDSVGEGFDRKITVGEALKIADVKLKGIKLKKEELLLEERKKTLIPIAWIARRDAEMSSILEDQFRRFDARVGEELCDMAGVEDAGTKNDIKKKIRDEIDTSMQIWKKTLTERLEAMLA